jgi:pyruvate dehydrogenase E1 component beta subunit
MKEITYKDAIAEALREEMERDQRVYIIGLDIVTGLAFGTTTGMIDEFGPKRIVDTPISENSVVGLAVGAAITGLRPVVEIQVSDFMTVCMEQIINQAAKAHFMTGGQVNVPLVIRAPGGYWGSFAAQHSQSLESIYMHIPGLIVAVPSSPQDVKGLLKTAIRDDNPVIFLESKRLYPTKGPVPDGDFTIPFGKADIKKQGKDITIVTYSGMILESMQAASQLEKEGISAEVIDLRTILPLDEETIIESVKKTGKVLIAEEDCVHGGVGAEVAARIVDKAYEYLDGPVRRIAAKMSPIPFSPQLEKYILPSTNDIINEIRNIMSSY